MAIKLADTARPNNYVDAEHLGTYPVAYAEDVWFADGTRLSEKTFDGQSIQKEELPLASADELGNIYQYVGESGTYTKGYFYECVSDGKPSPTYSWKAVISAGDSIQKEELPVASEEELGNIYQYIGNTTFSLTNGHFYKCVSNGGSTPVYSWEETEVSRTYKTISRNPAGGSSGLDAGFTIVNFIPVTNSVDKEINSYLLTLTNNVNNSISIILQTTYSSDLGYGVKAIAVEDNNNMIEKIPKFVYNDTQKYIFFILPRSWRQQDTTISLMQIGGKKMDFRLADASGGYTGANVVFHNVENLKKTFTGTQAEWDALTTDKKLTYRQVNITDDESDPSVVVDAVIDGDMHAVTSNAVYDEFKKVQSQTYEGYGFIINSNNGEIGGYGHIIVTLKNGIAEINFSARIQDNNGSSTFNWGLNRDLLHTLIPDLPSITPIGNYSNLQFFAATGAVLVDLMGFGAMASVTNQFWTPARMYKTDGSTGTWGSDQFPANSYITGTVYGIYTV